MSVSLSSKVIIFKYRKIKYKNNETKGVFTGFNGTILAYGQTSSGKTHTMYGYDIYDIDSKGNYNYFKS